MNRDTIYLHDIATVVPEHSFTQEYVLDFVLKLQGDTKYKRNFLKRVYRGTAIEKRHTVVGDYKKEPADYTFYPPNEDLKPEPSTAQRNELYIKESKRLSLKATAKLLDQLKNIDKKSITHLITVSCTGFAAPGIDFHISKELELNSSINRFHIGFMGCYAAFPALKLARSICRAEPDARVLIVNVELCSLHFQQIFEPDIIVANAIFADGVSAALVSANESDSSGNKLTLNNFHSEIIDDSEDDMAWKIGETGFDMKLSAYVPRLIEGNLRGVMDTLFNKSSIEMSDIDLWAVHPGGRAILDKIHESLELKGESLKVSYDVLKEYGNMSSVTIMFVLKKILENDTFGKIFSVGFGPGLTVESGIMEKVN